MKIFNKLFLFVNKNKSNTISTSKLLFIFILVCLFILFTSLSFYENELQKRKFSSAGEIGVEQIKQQVILKNQKKTTTLSFTQEELKLIDDLQKTPIKYYYNPDFGISTEDRLYDPQYFYIEVLESLLDIDIEIIQPIDNLTALDAVQKGIADFTTISEYSKFDKNSFAKSIAYSREKIYAVGNKNTISSPNGKEAVLLQDYTKNIDFDMVDYNLSNISYYNNFSNKEKLDFISTLSTSNEFFAIGNYKHISTVAKDRGAYLKEYASSADLQYTSENKDFIALINKVASNLDTNDFFTLNHMFSLKSLQTLFIDVLNKNEKDILKNANSIFYFDETYDHSKYGYTSFYYTYIDSLVQIVTGTTNTNIQNHKLPEDVSYISNLLVKVNIENSKSLDSHFYKTSSFVTEKPDLLSYTKNKDQNIIYTLESLKFFKLGVLDSQKTVLLEYLQNEHNLYEFKDVIIYNDLNSLLDGILKNEVDFCITYPNTFNAINYKSYNEYSITLHNSNYLLNNVNWIFETSNYFLNSILDKYILLTKSNNEYEEQLINSYIENNILPNNLDDAYRITIFTICVIMSFVLFYLLKRYDTKKLIEQSKKFDEEIGVFTHKAFDEYILNAKGNYTIITIKINDYNKLRNIYSIDEIDELNKILIYRLKMFNFGLKTELFSIYNGEYYIFIKNLNTDNLQEEKVILNSIKNPFTVFEKEVILNYKINKINSNYVERNNIPIFKFVNYMNLQKNNVLRKDSILIFKNSMYSKLYDSIKLEKVISDFDISSIHPFYQPIINIKTGEIMGVETFSRIYINNKVYKASEFIDLAEKIDKLKVIDEYLLNNTIIKREDLLQKRIINKNFYFTLNISEPFIKNISNELLKKLCQFHNLQDLSFLVFEMTEGIIKNPKLAEKIDIIKKYKIKISLETLDNGLYVFNAIDDNKIDIIKINKALVMLKNQNLIDIVKNIIQLPDIDYICRFVETSEEYYYLKKLGFEKLQGYYFAEPKNYEDLVKYLDL